MPGIGASVLDVLTRAEVEGGAVLGNTSYHRPANASLLARLGPQTIPRRIVQTGWTYDRARQSSGRLMDTWLDLNPEYEYNFFGDEHASRFVRMHGTPREAEAIGRILTGSQRSDLFRVIYLRLVGGVYADTDEGLRRPLRTLIGGVDSLGLAVPATATGVSNNFWQFEFLPFRAGHPIMVSAARIFTDNVLLHVALKQRNASNACRTPHECIIRNTGPLAYTAAVGDATQSHGCLNKRRTPGRGQCDGSSSPMLRRTHICSRDAGDLWNHWTCGTARHFDCRNSNVKPKQTKCSRASHYSMTRRFYRLGPPLIDVPASVRVEHAPPGSPKPGPKAAGPSAGAGTAAGRVKPAGEGRTYPPTITYRR